MKANTCRYCGEPFVWTAIKPGRINVCTEPHCQARDRRDAPEPEKLMAEVSWENKHTPLIRITTAAKAIPFNAALRRRGPTANLKFGSYAWGQDELAKAKYAENPFSKTKE